MSWPPLRPEDGKPYNPRAGQQPVIQRHAVPTLQLSSEVSTPPSVAWRFGIEMELTLCPNVSALRRSQTYSNTLKGLLPPGGGSLSWSQVGRLLEAMLRTAVGFTHQRSVALGKSGALDYSKWSIISDGSILPEEGFYGFEIVSPVFTCQDDWQGELKTLWELLQSFFHVQASSSCATHIHVSPGQGPWTARQLALLAKCIVYYDPLIDVLVPEERHGSYYCRSNIFAEGVARDLNKGFGHVFKHIDNLANDGSLRDFVRYISPERTYAWNFTNLEGSCGTVELRRPPMSRNLEEAIKWTKFATAFVTSATQHDLSRDLRPNPRGPTLSTFQSFILSSDNILEPLFAEKVYLIGMTRVNPITYQEAALWKKKEEKKSVSTEKMKQAQRGGQ